MSLGTGNTATSADIKAFKTALDNELFSTSRRGMGQSPYGGGSFINQNGTASIQGSIQLQQGFTHSADQSALIRTSHYNETVGYITSYFYNTSGVYVGWPASKNAGDILGQVWDIYNLLVNHIAQTAAASVNSLCISWCSGLCQGTCSTGCADGCTSEHGNCSNYLGGQYPCTRG